MTFYLTPTLDTIRALAERALREIPPILREHVRDVVIRVEEFPDEETCREMELDSPYDLLGLYRGVSLDRKSAFDVPSELDMVFLYRQPLLDYAHETGEDVAHLVRHVMIHEIGHHFGFSDEDMEWIEEEP